MEETLLESKNVVDCSCRSAGQHLYSIVAHPPAFFWRCVHNFNTLTLERSSAQFGVQL